MQIKAIITGSTGMVGKGVLLECLDNENVDKVLLLNRRALGIEHPKIKEIIVKDFFNLYPIKDSLKSYNACFFCLGISSAGVKAETYKKITYDLTIHLAGILSELNENMCFIYVSGTGTSTSEKSRMRWANVKGKTENDILKLPFKEAYMFRPGFIQPKKGIVSRTRLYRFIYFITSPLFPVFRILFPTMITNTVFVGKAMINAVLHGYHKKWLENKDINHLAKL